MNQDMLKKLKERRDKAWEDAKGILDAAEAEGRDLSGEEEASWQKANADMDAIDSRLQQVAEAEQRRADTEAAFEKLLAQQPVEQHRETPNQESQVRSFLRGDTREFVLAPERIERRADTGLVVGTSTAGGDTVPTSFYAQLVQHMIEVSGIMQAGPTVLQTSGGEPIDIPKTTTHPSAALGSENTAITESDPVFGQASLSAYKFDTLVQVSRELIDDTAVDILGYLATACGRAVGNKMGSYLITGTGSSQPSGVVTGASSGVTGGTGASGAFTADNLIDLEYSVIEPYTASPSCGFLMRRASAGAMRKLKNDNGDYLWAPSLATGRPATFDGFPVWTDPNVAAIATSAKSVLFGDFSQYFVRLAGPVRFERSDDYAFNKDMVTFRCIQRGDGVLVDQTGAVKYFAGGAS